MIIQHEVLDDTKAPAADRATHEEACFGQGWEGRRSRALVRDYYAEDSIVELTHENYSVFECASHGWRRKQEVTGLQDRGRGNFELLGIALKAHTARLSAGCSKPCNLACLQATTDRGM